MHTATQTHSTSTEPKILVPDARRCLSVATLVAALTIVLPFVNPTTALINVVAIPILTLVGVRFGGSALQVIADDPRTYTGKGSAYSGIAIQALCSILVLGSVLLIVAGG